MDATESSSEGLKRRHPAPQGEESMAGLKSSSGNGKPAKNTRKKPSPPPAPFPWVPILGFLLACSVSLLVLLSLGVVTLPVNSNRPINVHSTQHQDVEKENAIREPEYEAVHEPAHQEVEEPSDWEDLGVRGDQWTEVLSWEPRAYIYHNFLSKEECEYLIELAKPKMEKSTVVDNETGKSKDSRVRTSSGTFLKRGQDKHIRAIEKRIADYSFIPVEHGEGLQVLHYEVGQKYESHFDYFADEYNTRNGGQRIATLLMYLSDVEEGGETVFPNAKVNSSSLPHYDELSECGKQGLAARPKMGDALLFWSLKPDATEDPSSLHAGCPVIKGNKWSSTKWMRINEYKVY